MRQKIRGEKIAPFLFLFGTKSWKYPQISSHFPPHLSSKKDSANWCSEEFMFSDPWAFWFEGMRDRCWRKEESSQGWKHDRSVCVWYWSFKKVVLSGIILSSCTPVGCSCLVTYRVVIRYQSCPQTRIVNTAIIYICDTSKIWEIPPPTLAEPLWKLLRGSNRVWKKLNQQFQIT